MGRIGSVFRYRKRPAFIAYAVGGDPDYAGSLAIARVLIAAGADILELGVPFSDPVADGPVIQKAGERALAAGMTPSGVFALVREIRAFSEIPLVLLTYYNTVFRRGIGRFCCEAAEAGVDGILVADMPVEESAAFCRAAQRYGIDPIFLVTRTTSDERIRMIAGAARGYLYLVSVLGVTGMRETVDSGAFDLLQRVREKTDLPLALGFGISAPDHAKACAAAGADAVIVGSAIVAIIERNLLQPDRMERELTAYVRRMKAAL